MKINAFTSLLSLGYVGALIKISPDLTRSKVLYNQNKNPYGKHYYEELMERKNQKENLREHGKYDYVKLPKTGNRKYPLSQLMYEQQLMRLNNKNNTIKDKEFLKEDLNGNTNGNEANKRKGSNYVILNKKNLVGSFEQSMQDINKALDGFEDDDLDDADATHFNAMKKGLWYTKKTSRTKSENFEVALDIGVNFTDIGGYSNIKKELEQCVELLRNHTKYSKFNVRTPKGLVLEGPPGTGKTLLSKALAGEAKCAFIAVSGADFQEKYVGVGATRIKELFKLANENKPCIIFIDEIDAVGRKRSGDGDTSGSERDSTLNALLVELDGFKNNSGVFVISATNRIDLLDPALTRPGRIDKKIFLGLPDTETRLAIINIHLNGKPFDKTIKKDELVESTEGLTGAQIENLFNEAMLNALREGREEFNFADYDFVFNKMMVGWQPSEHQFTTDIIDHIAIHEMGHAVVGLLSKHHSKMTKVVINLSSPKSPGYTVFESSTSNIFTRESLFEHLMILLSGRIAEEVFYGASVTTGAINDFEEALKLAEKMVIYYGMGSSVIYPKSSDKYKELIDNDVNELLKRAYSYAESILNKSKDFIEETSIILKTEKYLSCDDLLKIMNVKYPELLSLKIIFIE